MPPRRPLPDLVLISVFKALTPNEQMKAHRLSPRCALLVRAANRPVKSLVITRRSVEGAEDAIASFSIISSRARKQLKDISGEPFSHYPMTITRFSQWHCLLIDDDDDEVDTETIEQITNIFSAVTDLKFSCKEYGQLLLSLLQHPNWQCQLTSLLVEGGCWVRKVAPVLIPAINGLTALQHLALDWTNDTDLPDLSILAQLKVVVFRSPNILPSFLRSLERHATENADLKVHLLSDDTKGLLTLSQPLHSRIARIGNRWSYTSYQVLESPLCRQFRFLTSLSIDRIDGTEVEPLFTVLSQLPQLIHLKLEVEIWWDADAELPPPDRPQALLSSLRVLELNLTITSHSQLQWLNLGWVMPSLQTIIINWFDCGSCRVRSSDTSFESLVFRRCFYSSSSLFTLHPGVQLNRFILLTGKEYISAEKLLRKVRPPPRPLSDRCLISVFKAMTPNEQMEVSWIIPRCARLVRAANRRVKSLAIAVKNMKICKVLAVAEDAIDTLSIFPCRVRKQLMEISGEPFSDYPVTTGPLSEWNCLLLHWSAEDDPAIIEEITNVFSAITDLNFVAKARDDQLTLLSLLQHSNWQCQLTSLLVCGYYCSVIEDLIPAINGLTALQHLALDWSDDTDLPDLSILAQLKVMVFKSPSLPSFLRSLERHATDNPDLKVHLLSSDTEGLLTLSQPLHSRIVHFGGEWHYGDDHLVAQVPLLCTQFRSLTSLSIEDIDGTKVGPLFTALSQLPQLVHLNLRVDLNSGGELPPNQPQARLPSLRVLQLDLKIASHSQLDRLNLVRVMPKLQAIIINEFGCRDGRCRDGLRWSFLRLDKLYCFPSSLSTLHPGVPLKQYIMFLSGYECISAEKMLQAVRAGESLENQRMIMRKWAICI